MRFLIDANLPRSTGPMLLRYGHEAIHVRDVGLGPDDAEIARHAQENGLALVTRDFDFSDIRNYPPQAYAGLVVLKLPDDAVASVVVSTFEAFLSQRELLERLPGRLAIVEGWRVRFRPN
jgi:predicted nuclease of predicted toxin-antitoxin system